ncbi:BnaC07g15550D [Brassica napus]|uniref:BnaC07g15550D protein n=1 Tax=Brassica napus TaxID=3708 RepID=A0A078I4N3_BRANA|nr:BnaC07g15550D [Brassica napus]
MLSCSYAVNCLANLIRICHVCIRYKVSTEALEQYIMLVFWFKSW